MDWEKIKENAEEFIRKYRYAFLILMAGIFLLTIPVKEKPNTPAVLTTDISLTETTDLQTELEMLLSRMEGAGKVRVLLTQACGEEITYQTDEEIDAEENAKDIRRKTVIITKQDRIQEGLILRIDPPIYMGAVILCQGADSAAVRLALMEAVKSATGLPANKITVLKMK